jgi:predicted  nucleic acid-binding Zn-ribbon protein
MDKNEIMAIANRLEALKKQLDSKIDSINDNIYEIKYYTEKTKAQIEDALSLVYDIDSSINDLNDVIEMGE